MHGRDKNLYYFVLPLIHYVSFSASVDGGKGAKKGKTKWGRKLDLMKINLFMIQVQWFLNY
jgi:hypothetical protein